jgi:DNA-binding transcriptional LysR family regulator
MPTARQLEVFLAAAQARSFRRAAELLNISQASVSKQIDALERAVGGQVFERRRGSRAELSLLGTSLQRDAEQMLRLQRRWAGGGAPADRQEQQTVYVRSYLLETAIKPRLEELRSRGLPRRTLFVVVDDVDEMCWRIRKDRASIGLLRVRNLPTNASIRSASIRSDACSLYVAPVLAGRIVAGTLLRSDLTILLPLQGAQTSESLREPLLQAGFGEQQFRCEGQFLEPLINAAVAGKGGVVLMEVHAREFVATRALVKLIPLYNLELIVVGNTDGPPDRFRSLVNVFSVV